MTLENPQSPPSLDAIQTTSQPTSPTMPRSHPIRALVTSREAGIIIGKGGRNVQEIREETSARINITELIERSVERVLAVTGTPESIAKAFSLIATKLLEEANSSNSGAQNAPQSPVDVVTIRLLVPHTRMGAIIGKAGQKIKEIQETSKTRVVASDQTLPSSTDRAVAVTGTPDGIFLCLNQIATILEEIGGGDRSSLVLGQQQMYRPGAMNMDARRFGSSSSPAQPNGIQTQHLSVPVDMVGCIIGKGGAKINELRQLSGAQIRISDAAESSEERIVSVTGSPEATQMALYLLYSRLESEKKKMVQKMEKPPAVDIHPDQH